MGALSAPDKDDEAQRIKNTLKIQNEYLRIKKRFLKSSEKHTECYPVSFDKNVIEYLEIENIYHKSKLNMSSKIFIPSFLIQRPYIHL